MQVLADKLNVSVTPVIPHRLDMVYIAWRASARMAALRLGVGSLPPMAPTSVGRAYLNGLPDAMREPLMAELLNAGGDDANAVCQKFDAAFGDLSR